MKTVYVYSGLLIMGLLFSQMELWVTGAHYEALVHVIKLMTMWALAFIMIRVGYEFDLVKSDIKRYTWDYFVAATAATFPWVLCSFYFVWFLLPAGAGQSLDAWKDALLTARFASPTSAGVLFAMLAAAGLSATWVFKKARILAIFDDLDTILFMIPLQLIFVGLKWQLGVVFLVVTLLVWLAWKYMHVLKIPITWPWVFSYSTVLVIICEAIYFSSHLIDELVPIHIEVLLPAFVLGCMIARNDVESTPEGIQNGHHQPDVLDSAGELRVATWVSALFMVLIGLSMPPLLAMGVSPEAVQEADLVAARAYVVEDAGAPASRQSAREITGADDGETVDWAVVAFHVLMITLVSNLGKMFPAFCYKREASWRERLAVAVAMFPRGEVGAGVLLIALSYNISGTIVLVAILSLALNLVLTGVFIVAVKRLVAADTSLPSREPA